jgi:hypothetical protein
MLSSDLHAGDGDIRPKKEQMRCAREKTRITRPSPGNSNRRNQRSITHSPMRQEQQSKSQAGTEHRRLPADIGEVFGLG